jgi:hypothetical protein
MQGLVVIAQPLGSKGSVKGQVGTVTAISRSCCWKFASESLTSALVFLKLSSFKAT